MLSDPFCHNQSFFMTQNVDFFKNRITRRRKNKSNLVTMKTGQRENNIKQPNKTTNC